jgi:UPF0176 protein
MQRTHIGHTSLSRAAALEERASQLRARMLELSRALPGSSPYENPRPLFVQQRHEGLSLEQFCCTRLPHIGRDYWRMALDEGRIQYQGKRASGSETVAAGAIVVHTEPNTVEPAVNPQLELLYEDAALVALNKPAPLPVHPCGRFNKNTVTHLLSLAWPESRLRPVHRLDANTTGVLVLAKSRSTARELSQQFASQQVEKRYLAEVRGHPRERNFEVRAAVSSTPSKAGRRRITSADDGRTARTTFAVIGVTRDDHTLLEACPRDGRTNQIRLHLSRHGLPIVGDHAYRLRVSPPAAEDGLTSPEPIHLHAWRLTIRTPDGGKLIELQAPEPEWTQAPGLTGACQLKRTDAG